MRTKVFTVITKVMIMRNQKLSGVTGSDVEPKKMNDPGSGSSEVFRRLLGP